MSSEKIEIKGARQNNLKNVSLDIEHDRLTVFTGVSGSGKTSLVFDTLFAEGQRRFVESQSTYARQFMQRLDKPDVDSIEGLRPTIAVRAKNAYKTSRSTVGTVTEIYDHLRLVFAKVGSLHCPECGDPVRAAGIDEIIAAAGAAFEGEQAYVLAPLEASEKMTPALLREMVRARGYSYIMADAELIDLETADDAAMKRALGSNGKKSGAGECGLYIAVDRLAAGARKKRRLADSIETALREGGGAFKLRSAGGKEKTFSVRQQCLKCGIEVARPSPQQLSFNSAVGACPNCRGFGDTYEIDMDAVVPDKTKTLREGALECWNTKGIRRYVIKMFNKSEDELGVRPDVPFNKLTPLEIERLMKGHGVLYGLEPFFERMKQKSYKLSNRYFLMRYRALQRCPECGGTRLNRIASTVRLAGKTIAEVGMMPLSEVADFFQKLDIAKSERETVKIPLREIASRTQYLKEIGLGYLTLWRPSRTLSGGEMQRIHLASHLGSRLTGTLYALDEPTVGLHPRDTERLVRVLEDLRDIGNTVLVVEHDMQVVRECDRVVDIGPGAGERGGEIVFNGTVADFIGGGDTLTADYLTGRKKVSDLRRARASGAPRGFFTVRKASHNNLKDIDAAFPIGRFTCVTGVSGSGKSTLVCDILHPWIARRLGLHDGPVGACGGVDNWQSFKFVEMSGQEPIGHNPRANALTYMEAFSQIRAMLAATGEARRRGLGPGAFSFNVAEGRCPKCEGSGVLEIDMQFLADVAVVCDTCNGSRYQPHVLEVTLRDKNITDIFAMTVSEAMAFFRDQKKLSRKFFILEEVGLGYLRLGQPLSTLSGGEAQRLKIARELDNVRKGAGLYIFDEPTMGLHPDEVGRFLRCVDRLIAEGHSVVVIEHNLDVVAQADHIIDLGPGGGGEGGRVVAQGAPEKIANVKDSVTGAFLKKHISGNKITPAPRRRPLAHRAT
jgi:excinuclease ABC subunit A